MKKLFVLLFVAAAFAACGDASADATNDEKGSDDKTEDTNDAAEQHGVTQTCLLEYERKMLLLYDMKDLL